jgi:hypothetical protein
VDVPEYPVDHLSVADLNFMVAAMLTVGAQMIGPDFIPKVIATAEQMQLGRDMAITHLDD